MAQIMATEPNDVPAKCPEKCPHCGSVGGNTSRYGWVEFSCGTSAWADGHLVQSDRCRIAELTAAVDGLRKENAGLVADASRCNICGGLVKFDGTKPEAGMWGHRQ